MLEGAPDAICASPYGLGSDRVRTPSTVNALPGSRPPREHSLAPFYATATMRCDSHARPFSRAAIG